MLNEAVKELLNVQVNKEFYSAYLYLDFSNFYQYLHNNGVQVIFEAIEKPNVPLENLMDVLKAGLQHEQYVTSLIYHIYAAAQEAKDFRTTQFLDWFVKEQGEEEKNAQDLINKMEMFGNDPRSLYLLNEELKTRVYAAPSLVL